MRRIRLKGAAHPIPSSCRPRARPPFSRQAEHIEPVEPGGLRNRVGDGGVPGGLVAEHERPDGPTEGLDAGLRAAKVFARLDRGAAALRSNRSATVSALSLWQQAVGELLEEDEAA